MMDFNVELHFPTIFKSSLTLRTHSWKREAVIRPNRRSIHNLLLVWFVVSCATLSISCWVISNWFRKYFWNCVKFKFLFSMVIFAAICGSEEGSRLWITISSWWMNWTSGSETELGLVKIFKMEQFPFVISLNFSKLKLDNLAFFLFEGALGSKQYLLLWETSSSTEQFLWTFWILIFLRKSGWWSFPGLSHSWGFDVTDSWKPFWTLSTHR